MSDAAPSGETTSTPGATPTEAAPPDTGTQQQTNSTTDVAELQAEVARLKAQSERWESRAKGNSSAVKELEALKRQSMSDIERAVADARNEAAQETAKRFGSRVVDAEIRAAAAGRVSNVDALLETLDRSTFLTDDFEPNSDAIASWVDRLAAADDQQPTTQSIGTGFTLDLGQGQRGKPAAASSGDPLLDAVVSKVGVRHPK